MTESDAQRRRLAAALYALGSTLIRRLPRELNLTALSTMSTLDRTGPRRITDLAVLQGVSQPSMTSLVKSLERDGYVARGSDPDDGRVALVALTSYGADTLADRRRAGADAVEGLLDKMDPDEVTRLLAALPALEHLNGLDDAPGER